MSKLSDFFIVVTSLTYLHDRREARKRAREREKRLHPVKAEPQPEPPAAVMFPLIGVISLLFAGLFALFTDGLYKVFLIAAGLWFFVWVIYLLMRRVSSSPQEKEYDRPEE